MLAAALPPARAEDRLVLERVSLDIVGNQADGPSGNAIPGSLASRCGGSQMISANGRYVAFTSAASNLVGGDTNGALDAFVRDRKTGETRRVSVSSAGVQANGTSTAVAISGDGRQVAFLSAATNLVTPADTNGKIDLYVYDMQTPKTAIVSVSSAENRANGDSRCASFVDGSGSVVVFSSSATNLAAGDTNFVEDVFLRYRDPGFDGSLDDADSYTMRVSIDSSGRQLGAASTAPATGRYEDLIFFQTPWGVDADDANESWDVYVHDRDADDDGNVDDENDGNYDPGDVATIRVSLAADPTSPPPCPEGTAPSVSADARVVAWDFCGQVWVSHPYAGIDGPVAPYDLFTQPYHGSAPAVAADGGAMAFVSSSSEVAPGDTNGADDVFYYEFWTGSLRALSIPAAPQAGEASVGPSISADGDWVSFESTASNLVTGDMNGVSDVFVYGIHNTISFSVLGPFVSGDDGYYVGDDDLTVILEAYELEVTFECALDDEPLHECAGEETWEDLPPGSHDLIVDAIDWRGDRVRGGGPFTVDTTPPSIEFLSPRRGITVAGGTVVPADVDPVVVGRTEVVVRAADSQSGIGSVVILKDGVPVAYTRNGDLYTFELAGAGTTRIEVTAVNQAGDPSTAFLDVLVVAP